MYFFIKEIIKKRIIMIIAFMLNLRKAFLKQKTRFGNKVYITKI